MKTARIGWSARLLRDARPLTYIPIAWRELIDVIVTLLESALLPTVRLSPVHPIVHASDKDYDHWIGYVCQHIDQAATFEVDVKAAPWGSKDTTQIVSGQTDHGYESLIDHAILALAESFQAALVEHPDVRARREVEAQYGEAFDAMKRFADDPKRTP